MTGIANPDGRLADRLKRALARQGTATAAVLAAGLGENVRTVRVRLKQGLAEGWCRIARMDGRERIYGPVT